MLLGGTQLQNLESHLVFAFPCMNTTIIIPFCDWVLIFLHLRWAQYQLFHLQCWLCLPKMHHQLQHPTEYLFWIVSSLASP